MIVKILRTKTSRLYLAAVSVTPSISQERCWAFTYFSSFTIIASKKDGLITDFHEKRGFNSSSSL